VVALPALTVRTILDHSLTMLNYRQLLDIPDIQLPDPDPRFFGTSPGRIILSAGQPPARPKHPVVLGGMVGRPTGPILPIPELKHRRENCIGKWTRKGRNNQGIRRVQCYVCGAVRLTVEEQ
jgi:hypothetical protein